MGHAGGAIATTAAVVVALFLGVYPIMTKRKENRDLRIRVIEVAETLRTSALLLPPMKINTSRQDDQSTEELKALLPLTTVLTAKEQSAIESLYLSLSATPE